MTVELVSITFSFVFLHYYLYRYYRFDFNLCFKSNGLFFACIFLLTIAQFYLYYVQSSDNKISVNVNGTENIVLMTGLRITLIMFVIIVIKASHDPFEGIQNIETATLLSINQKQTKKFIVNIYTTKKWGDLSKGA